MNWEISFLEFLNNTFSGGFFDRIMVFLSTLGNGGFLWIASAFVMLFFKKWRKAGVAMLIALAVGFIVTNLTLKPLVARTRPFDVNPEFTPIIPLPLDFSFPSGHTCSSFAAAVALTVQKRKAGIFALAVAALIAFSRMYLLVHFPTDIMAGAVVGVVSGFISTFFVNKTKKL